VCKGSGDKAPRVFNWLQTVKVKSLDVDVLGLYTVEDTL
jgi:hypothetical protein